MPTLTMAQQRQQAKASYDAFLAVCPSRQLLNRIGDKWIALVLSALDQGPLRYSELSRRIAGVSQKMLTQSLRNLERDGLIRRTVTASVPVRVDYEMTDLGKSLYVIVLQLKCWAENNMGVILARREEFDSASQAAS
ncbi:winged helix-turn-helix transcriptional regulator [Psychromicrobium sp. YIM B11713]|uniref:winged helix-turn-helix transcriptional regulator n=1 Tax=Psychromicrobium sp. YIM B11713 TaxID=3145233 RepID=UPI00374FBB28